MDLIFYNGNDTFSFKLEEHEVSPAKREKGKTLRCKDLRKYILRTFNQKTPKQYERSGAALMSLSGASCLHAFFRYWRTSD